MKHKITDIPQVTFKKFDSLIVPIDKLSNCLFAENIWGIESIIEDKRLKISSPVKIIYPSDDPTKASLAPIEKLIFNVLISAQDAGNDYISYFKLYQLLGGGEMLTGKLKKIIDNALWKLRCTDLTINLTDIVSKRKKYADKLDAPYNQKNFQKNITWRGVILPHEVITTKINGKISDSVIHFLGKSIILRVADLKDQIARADLSLLAVPIRSTFNTLSLTNYLLERILKIKGSNDDNKKHVTKLENSISFETLFKQCGLPSDTKKQRWDIRNNVAKILDFFKSQGFIDGYEFFKNPGGDFSVKIFY